MRFNSLALAKVSATLSFFAIAFSAPTFAAATSSSKQTLQSRLHFSSSNSKRYEVGHDIPSVGFKTRNSWAGEMPIGPNSNASSYFFWLWGATEEGSTDDTVIWLNGGPGCSSLIGFLQEIGPFEQLPGEKKPVQNPDTWLRAANVLWVEQPANVGFSTASNEIINTEDDVARDFHGYLSEMAKTFPELFAPGKRLWIAGESYAGRYIPYIAHELLQKGNKFNLQGMLLFDAVISDETLMEDSPVHLFVKQNNHLLNLTSDDVAAINSLAKSCKYDKLYDEYLVYPSKGPLPDYDPSGCSIFNAYYVAASRANPNFNVYRISDRTPQDSVLGDGNSGYAQDDFKTFFDNSELKDYIHAPKSKKWVECLEANPDKHLFPKYDQSESPEQVGILQSLVETLPSGRTIIANGELGVALALQNLTWKGTRGFSKPIDKTLTDLTGKPSGRYRTQRGLTFAIVDKAGHTVPSRQDASSVGLKLVKYMLGQVKSL